MSSYRQIFKSTALVGGAQVITMLVGLVRGKALAVWLGAEGVGLVGLLSTGVGLIGVVTGLGIGASGVRQIAESSSSGDQEKLARTARTLRLVALITSVVGMLLPICFCRQLSCSTSKPPVRLCGMPYKPNAQRWFSLRRTDWNIRSRRRSGGR